MKEKIKSLAELNEELRALVKKVRAGELKGKMALSEIITVATDLAVRQERLVNGMKLSLESHLQKRDTSTVGAVLLLLGKDIGKEVLEPEPLDE